jgi:hypothetical protein
MTKSLSLLVALLSVPGSFAYVASTSSTGTTTVRTPTFLPKTVEQTTSTSQPPKYDLGLGKNPPVIGKRTANIEEMSTYDAARFWMIPEAVSNYPSPLKRKQEQPKKRKPQQVIPSRMAPDAVDISGTNSEAKAVFQVKPVDLEMNTLWVEMLIHHQQNLMAAAV